MEPWEEDELLAHLEWHDEIRELQRQEMTEEEEEELQYIAMVKNPNLWRENETFRTT